MDNEMREAIKRIDAEDGRQNRRIQQLEDDYRELLAINTNVERLATNMERMLEEQTRLRERLDAIEAEPLETMKNAKRTAINKAVDMTVGALILAIVYLIARYI